MRTRTGMVAAAAAFTLVLAACGGDDGGGSAEADLLDDPSVEDCQDAVRTFFDQLEVPDGIDPSDGIDDGELAVAEAAVDDAAEGLFDPADVDHPCNVALDGMTDEEQEEFIASLPADKVAFFGSLAQTEFVPIEGEL